MNTDIPYTRIDSHTRFVVHLGGKERYSISCHPGESTLRARLEFLKQQLDKPTRVLVIDLEQRLYYQFTSAAEAVVSLWPKKKPLEECEDGEVVIVSSALGARVRMYVNTNAACETGYQLVPLDCREVGLTSEGFEFVGKSVVFNNVSPKFFVEECKADAHVQSGSSSLVHAQG
jgi:hypothetical protein